MNNDHDFVTPAPAPLGPDAPDAPDEFEVYAAGGIPWRWAAGGSLQVVVVHRPRYDDWSFPKGKLDAGETFEQAAVRELAEETGYVVDLGVELPSVTYVDHQGRSKLVRWWAMTVSGGDFSPNDEVDELAWMSIDEAIGCLTRDSDRGLLTALSGALGQL